MDPIDIAQKRSILFSARIRFSPETQPVRETAIDKIIEQNLLIADCCKDSNRREEHAAMSFDFLGFTFRPRLSKSRSGRYFVNFGPAVSNKAGKVMRQKARRWHLHLRSDSSLEDLSRIFSPIIRGWINYYGSFYKSAMYPTLRHLNKILVRWARRKFKRLRYHLTKAVYWLGRIAKRQPELFPHWQVGVRPTVG